MNDAIVGYTGFVGSNIASKHKFTNGYHSTDITKAYGTDPDLLVYSGVSAEMFLANNYPDKDREVIENAMNNIERIHPAAVVLISTIAVYDDPFHADEDTDIDESKLTAYGINRRMLEKYVETEYGNHLIIRLPALFGKGIRKNFIYDLIHVIPPMLTEKKFLELTGKDSFIEDFYQKQSNGFYKCRQLNRDEDALLKQYFRNTGFSALNFTDSRSVYQYYNLSYLWEHIERALKLGIQILNMATEPVPCTDLYRYLYGSEFENQIAGRKPFNYDYRTKYAADLGGEGGYIFGRDRVMKELKDFIIEEQK